MRRSCDKSHRDPAERFYGSADHFGSTLSASGALASVAVEKASEIELRRQYVFLALIVLFLTIEWFIRKRSGMV